MHVARGRPVRLIGLPLRYMHSPVEMVELDDIARRGEADRRRGPAPDRGDDFAR